MLLLIVRFIHTLIVLFVLLSPFVPQIEIPCLHSVFVPFLILHWLTNDKCALGYLESTLTGVRYNDTFINRALIGPVYRVSDKMIWIATIVLWTISIVRLYRCRSELVMRWQKLKSQLNKFLK